MFEALYQTAIRGRRPNRARASANGRIRCCRSAVAALDSRQARGFAQFELPRESVTYQRAFLFWRCWQRLLWQPRPALVSTVGMTT